MQTLVASHGGGWVGFACALGHHCQNRLMRSEISKHQIIKLSTGIDNPLTHAQSKPELGRVETSSTFSSSFFFLVKIISHVIPNYSILSPGRYKVFLCTYR